nr:ferritin-like domain-containing protein [Laribacter hongkongensis]
MPGDKTSALAGVFVVPDDPVEWRAMNDCLYTALETALRETDPAAKCRQVQALAAASRTGRLRVRTDAPPAVPLPAPGAPSSPRLIDPRDVPRRRTSSREGRIALLHAIAHIEFNAINLALDAAWRFRRLPDAFRADWIRVAEEEARHYQLVVARLADYGCDYGDLDAHAGLWEMVVKTAHDPLVRMALVPRLMEARGLDVNPGIQQKFAAAGDTASVAALEVILAEEVGHVAIGNHWFGVLCRQRGLEPLATFVDLLAEYAIPAPRPPFNLAGRQAAGFTPAEIDWLTRGVPA